MVTLKKHLILAGALGCFCGGMALAQSPYTPDAYTSHLWHFDAISSGEILFADRFFDGNAESLVDINSPDPLGNPETVSNNLSVSGTMLASFESDQRPWLITSATVEESDSGIELGMDGAASAAITPDVDFATSSALQAEGRLYIQLNGLDPVSSDDGNEANWAALSLFRDGAPSADAPYVNDSGTFGVLFRSRGELTVFVDGANVSGNIAFGTPGGTYDLLLELTDISGFGSGNSFSYRILSGGIPVPGASGVVTGFDTTHFFITFETRNNPSLLQEIVVSTGQTDLSPAFCPDSGSAGMDLTFDESSGMTGSGFNSAFTNSLNMLAPLSTAGAFGPENVPTVSFQNPVQGAFTYEALLYLDFDPAGDTRTMQILSMENDDSNDERMFMWKIDWDSGQISFVNIGGESGVQTVKCQLPESGIHQPVEGQWFHAAVTYNGLENTSGNISFYWTRLDSGAAEANKISGAVVLKDDLIRGASDPAVGNEARFISEYPWDGLIDEVRVSTIARQSWEFFFFEDTDSDGLRDEWERQWFQDITFTDGAGDPDSDGYDQAAEQAAGSDPTDPDSTPSDIDADGLPDSWETAHFNSVAYAPGDDPDGDGYDNASELAAGTDPDDVVSDPDDTDADGMEDADEVAVFGNLDQGAFDDFDGDGFGNLRELDGGTDPGNAREFPDGIAVRFIPVAVGDPSMYGYADSAINSAPFVQNNLLTVGDQQFITYYRRHAFDSNDTDNDTILIGRRTVGGSQWDIFRTGFHSNNIDDGHTAISFGIDGDGYLHMSWGMHGDPFHYAKSSASVLGTASILMIEQQMTGQETAVTYPKFEALPDGDLLYFYRRYGSGIGDWYLNRYSITNSAWSPVHADDNGNATPFFLGRGDSPDNCFYPNRLVQDSDGMLHLSGLFRYGDDSPAGETDYQTNHRYVYLRSPDEGVSWERSDGSAIALPVVEAGWFLDLGEDHVPEIIEDIPEGYSLINQTFMTTDSAGKPIIATWWAADAGNGDNTRQYHLFFHDGTNWNRRTISARDVDSPTNKIYAADLDNSKMSKPLVLCDAEDRIIVVYNDNRFDGITVVFSQPEAQDPARTNWTRINLTSEYIGGWEPGYDPVRWKRDGVLQMLYQKVSGVDADYADQNNATQVSVISWDAEAYFRDPPVLTLDVHSVPGEASLAVNGKHGFRYGLETSTNLQFNGNLLTNTSGNAEWIDFGAWPLIGNKRFWKVDVTEESVNNF